MIKQITDGLDSQFSYLLLFNFLLQIVEQFTIEKLSYRYIKTIAELFNGNNAGVLTLFIQHTVNR